MESSFSKCLVNLFKRKKTNTHKEYLSPSITYDIYDAVLHRDGVCAPMDHTRHHLVQEERHEILVRDEAPEIKVEVVRVHLDLLEAILAESTESDALQKGLECNLHNARQDGDLE